MGNANAKVNLLTCVSDIFKHSLLMQDTFQSKKKKKPDARHLLCAFLFIEDTCYVLVQYIVQHVNGHA